MEPYEITAEFDEAKQLLEALKRQAGEIEPHVHALLAQGRKTAVLEALSLMGALWREDELDIRKHFGLSLAKYADS